jgi:hypothetical protein
MDGEAAHDLACAHDGALAILDAMLPEINHGSKARAALRAALRAAVKVGVPMALDDHLVKLHSNSVHVGRSEVIDHECVSFSANLPFLALSRT